MQTSGFFMAEGDGSHKPPRTTARQAASPPNKKPNEKFERRNESKLQFNVLLGKKAYDDCLASIKARIGEHGIIFEHAELRIKAVEEQDDEEGAAEHKEAQDEIDRAEKAMEALSPPIRLGASATNEIYTEDYTIIEVDNDKTDNTST